MTIDNIFFFFLEWIINLCMYEFNSSQEEYNNFNLISRVKEYDEIFIFKISL